MDDIILRAENLQTHYFDKNTVVRAVNGVSLSLRRGSTLGIMGESGCGKTTVALSILRLVPYPGRIVSGRIFFEDREITEMGAEELRRLRGREISMIFQDPVSGLNPTLSVGTQVEEIITNHLSVSKKEARRMTMEALKQMGLPHPDRLVEQYPFHLSGGMCQRVMIAIATVLNPQVIIADEPTGALDVTVQAAILEELERLKRNDGTSIMLISHDLGIVAQMADEVAVMYAGSIVESGSVEALFQRPRHPYTWALLSTRPRIDEPPGPLRTIRGVPPDLGALPAECPFLPRCQKAVNQCRQEPAPALKELSPGHRAACFSPVYQALADQ
jgi:peptide/nickel transport system ATP-binding protein/oligopeptide transport system ATP-binding protein